MRHNLKPFFLCIGFALIVACTSTTTNNPLSGNTFDVKGLKIGDPAQKFEAMAKSDFHDLIVTLDKKTEKIVHIKYVQEQLPNTEKTQKYLINYICNKYGRVASCDYALSEIEAKDKQFVRFFHLYRNDAGTQELRALIRRTKTFSLIPDLRVEIDLVDSAYAKVLRKQKATRSELIDF